MMNRVGESITLPNGTLLSNRIAKSAMSENLSNKRHEPSSTLIRVYERWAKSGAGLLITGNVMVTSEALGEPRNVVVEDRNNLEVLKRWASTVHGTDTQLWAQLNHPGRQAMEGINTVLKAPSAVPLKIGGRKKAPRKIPKALTEEEILAIVEAFGRAAIILKEAGFSGVQIHGAHGYLVSQFLSPYTNIREDQWGGTLANRTRFVVQVYRKIRELVGKNFPIGIKLNSADFQKGGFTEEDSMEVIRVLSEEGIDLIEISGGTYEAPAMMGYKRSSTKQREAYFMEYFKKARKITNTPLMLTGGFRTPSVMNAAIEGEQVDVIGIARPFTVYPNMVNQIFEGVQSSFETSINKTGVKGVDAMMSIVWYEYQIKMIGKGKEPNPNLSAWRVLFNYIRLILEKKIFRR